MNHRIFIDIMNEAESKKDFKFFLVWVWKVSFFQNFKSQACNVKKHLFRNTTFLSTTVRWVDFK